MTFGSAAGRGRDRMVPRVLWVVVVLAACKPGAEPDPTAKLDLEAFQRDLADNVVLPLYRDFEAAASKLSDAVDAHTGALRTGPADAELRRAREAWADAMKLWQQAEVLQIGPAGPAKRAAGGQGLRDEIYSWPTVNPCRIDQETVLAKYGEPDFFSSRLVNVYGLDALEYLLFREDAGNDCPSKVAINSKKTWAALGDNEVRERRAGYAQAVAEQLAKDANRLRKAWDKSEGDFVSQLLRAGKPGSVYPKRRDALSDVFSALFYLDLRTKDRKLALPLGLSSKCPRATCPDALESPWAKHSKENIKANLVGFRSVYRGNATGASKSGYGFDDMLEELGMSALTKELSEDIAAAVHAVDELPDVLGTALESDPEPIRLLHGAVKRVTDKLKGEVVTALSLQVPAEAATDID
ncbi:MAG: imelysin family protein [Proteobacteria bacterium]|nr:imelysin family protein [Pseudomonadota bacterium]